MTVRSSVTSTTPASLVVEPDEPLAESAPLAWVEAPRRCSRHLETGDTCASYHRVWQYLRLLGVITSTRTDTDFLIASFRKYAATGRFSRAFVSGSADYSMLAHLNAAYAVERSCLDATVVDRCETPLFLNRWYASRFEVPLTTACGDLREYSSDRPFDLVCTHNLLGFYAPAERRRIVARWHALLRRGGVVVTTQRVQPNSTAERNFFTEEHAEELGSRMTAAARDCPHDLDVGPDALGRAAYEYAKRQRTYVIRTTRELTDLFEAEGFVLDLADDGRDSAARVQDRPANQIGRDSFRMRIVARRPEA